MRGRLQGWGLRGIVPRRANGQYGTRCHNYQLQPQQLGPTGQEGSREFWLAVCDFDPLHDLAPEALHFLSKPESRTPNSLQAASAPRGAQESDAAPAAVEPLATRMLHPRAPHQAVGPRTLLCPES